MAYWRARVERTPAAVGNPLPSIIALALAITALGGILMYLGWAGARIVAGLAGYATVGTLLGVMIGAGKPGAGFGIANQVTLLRAGLVCLAGGALVSGTSPIATWSLCVLIAVALGLDAVDGWLARRLDLASRFGARFDLEIDALLILVLAVLVWQSERVGAWVLAIGLMRYAFVLAGRVLPSLRRSLPPSRRRQAVCVQQGITLLFCLLPPVGSLLASASAALALLSLLASFAADLIYLLRAPDQPTTIGAVDRRTDRAILQAPPAGRDPEMCGNRT